MNQILITEDVNSKKEKKNKKQNYTGQSGKDIKSITRAFAIVILIFGLILSGSNAFALAQNIQDEKNKIIPVISFERNGNLLQLKVKNDIGIKNVKYSWNDSESTIVSGSNNSKVEFNVNIIPGQNKLNISVTDTKDSITRYVKNFEQEANDTTEPIINISNEDPKIKISVTDDTALDHIVYKYGDENEEICYPSNSDPTKIEVYIDNISVEQKTLEIEAIDKAGNHSTFKQEVKGVAKSVITVIGDQADPGYITIKVTDNGGLRMIVFYVNEQAYQTDSNISLNVKEWSYRIKVKTGDKIKVHAYNLSEQVTEFEGICQ